MLGGKTPLEVPSGKPFWYDHLRVFGSLCYARKLLRSADKSEERAGRCMLTGYPFGKKVWAVFKLETEDTFLNTY